MADIELVIKIPEDLYKATVNGLDANEIWDLRSAIANGTPLPNWYERLINEYISKVKCCDECFASIYCTVNGLRESRVPQDYCKKNIERYFSDNARPTGAESEDEQIMLIEFTKDFANNWKAGDIVEAKYLEKGEVLVDNLAKIDIESLLEHCRVISESKDTYKTYAE